MLSDCWVLGGDTTSICVSFHFLTVSVVAGTAIFQRNERKKLRNMNLFVVRDGSYFCRLTIDPMLCLTSSLVKYRRVNEAILCRDIELKIKNKRTAQIIKIQNPFKKIIIIIIKYYKIKKKINHH